LGFDRHQFARRKKDRHIVSADTKISFQDAGGMSIKRTNKNNNAWGIPPWTASDEKVQRVVALQLWKMTHMSFAGFPEERFQNDRLALVLELENELDRRCVSFVNQGDEMIRTGVHTYKVAKDFGYAKILTQVIYSKYRLGKAANTIAADLNDIVTPNGVRQLANRLCHTARVVFDDQDAPAPKRAGEKQRLLLDRWREQYSHKAEATDEGSSSQSFQGKWAFKKRREANKRVNRTIPLSNLELYQLTVNGRTPVDIAQEYGTNPDTVRARANKGKREFAGLPPMKDGCKKKLILSMHADGIPIEEIAREVKKPLAYVDCIVRNFGPAAGPEPCDCDE